MAFHTINPALAAAEDLEFSGMCRSREMMGYRWIHFVKEQANGSLRSQFGEMRLSQGERSFRSHDRDLYDLEWTSADAG